jgi:hypothetical protein
VRSTLTAAALVEVHDAILFGMKEATLFGLRTAAGAAMQKHYRSSRWVAAFLKIDLVDR